jgi:hypothetical protein
MEVPIIGCADNRPNCCPSLNPVTAPQSTSTVVVTVVENTEVVATLSADPLTKCPSDYTDLCAVRSTFTPPPCSSLFWQALTQQQWVYSVQPTTPRADTMLHRSFKPTFQFLRHLRRHLLHSLRHCQNCHVFPVNLRSASRRQRSLRT